MRSRGFHPPACVTLFPTHAEEFLFAAALGLACLPAFAVSSPWIEVRSPHFTAEEVLESQHNTDGAPMVLNEGRPTSTTPAQHAEIDNRIARLQHTQAASPNPEPSPSVAAFTPK